MIISKTDFIFRLQLTDHFQRGFPKHKFQQTDDATVKRKIFLE